MVWRGSTVFVDRLDGYTYKVNNVIIVALTRSDLDPKFQLLKSTSSVSLKVVLRGIPGIIQTCRPARVMPKQSEGHSEDEADNRTLSETFDGR